MKFQFADLADCLETDSTEFITRLDRETGQVVQLEASLLHAAEEGDEEALPDMHEWQQEQAALARAIAADDGSRFVDGPSKFDFHEYRHMERFIGTVENPVEAE